LSRAVSGDAYGQLTPANWEKAHQAQTGHLVYPDPPDQIAKLPRRPIRNRGDSFTAYCSTKSSFFNSLLGSNVARRGDAKFFIISSIWLARDEKALPDIAT
jgi:hypothetical protein